MKIGSVHRLLLIRQVLTCTLILFLFQPLSSQGVVAAERTDVKLYLRNSWKANYNWKFTILNGEITEDGQAIELGGAIVARAQLEVNVFLKRPSSDFRVILNLNTLSAAGWNLVAYQGGDHITLGHDSSTVLNFERTANGSASFNLAMGLGKKDNIAQTNWVDVHYIDVDPLVIQGIETEEDRTWAANQNTYSGLSAYVEQYEGGKYIVDALKKMSQILNEDYNNWVEQNDGSIAKVDRFIQKYNSFRQYDEVREKLALAEQVRASLEVSDVAPPPPPEPSIDDLDRAAFNRVRESQETNLILDYLAEYHRPPGHSALYFQAAQDSLLSWRPPYYEIVGESNGWTEFKLFNFGEPAYRDIYAHRLEVDDDQLLSAGLIRLRPLRSGQLEIEILDRRFTEKRLPIMLNNLMEAQMNYDSLSEQFTVSFKRGIKPYRLVLIEAESRLPVWNQDNINANEVQIGLAELKEAGLEGELIAQTYSEGAGQPLTIRNGTILLPVQLSDGWIIWALLAGGFLLLSVLIFFLIRNRKRRPPTIFDQA